MERISGNVYTEDMLRRMRVCEDAFIAFGGADTEMETIIQESICIRPTSFSIEGKGFDEFQLVSIELTEYQKKTLDNVANAFMGFADAMLTVIKAQSILINEFLSQHIVTKSDTDEILLHKYKSWEKKRFYN